jgi:hypothetical protein
MAAEERIQSATAVDGKTAEVAVALFDHLEDPINRTDTKAQDILAADAILLGWFSRQNPTAVQAVFARPASAVARAAALLIVLVFVGLFLSLRERRRGHLAAVWGIRAVKAGLFWGHRAPE